MKQKKTEHSFQLKNEVKTLKQVYKREVVKAQLKG